MVPLDCGHRDPWPTHRPERPLTDNGLDAWRATMDVLVGAGLCPVVPADAARGLHHRGGDDRTAVLAVHARGGVR